MPNEDERLCVLRALLATAMEMLASIKNATTVETLATKYPYSA